jgi:putative transposase
MILVRDVNTSMKRYSNEQIAFTLKQAESGVPVAEICRKVGITEQTFYRWKKKSGTP